MADHDSIATPADSSTLPAVMQGAGADLPRHPGATLHAADPADTLQPGGEPKYASHQDEYQALIGQTQDDLDYVERVQRIYFESEGGKHCARMIGALLTVRGEFVPRRDLELLLGEYQHIVAGGRVSSRAAPHASPCDCPPEHPFIRDGRCIEGIGCSDAI